MKWYKFIEKIKPDGKAFRSIEYTKVLFEVLADALQMIVDYADYHINDQVWWVNDNFDPEPWEARYDIVPSSFSTLNDRREVVKSYMLYPQSGNRLSRDFIQDTLNDAGYSDVTVEYNSSGSNDGYLHANDSKDETGVYLTGPLTYNSFILSGTISANYQEAILLLALSLKPLQVAIYNQMEILTAIAIDDTLAWAIDDTLATALSTT